jgi:hypothetical protein
MSKRYSVTAYYGEGQEKEFIGSTDSYAEARQAALDAASSDACAVVYDSDTQDTVFQTPRIVSARARLY